MKTMSFLGLILLFLTSFNSDSELCNSLLFFKEGTSTTMTSYDDDAKETGKVVTLYQKITTNEKGTQVSANQENFDKKGKSVSKNDFIIRCENGNLYFDMRMFIPQEQMSAYKDMQMTVDGSDMEFPAILSEGMTLKDATVSIKVSSNGTPMPMMNFTINMFNRKVELKEDVTTVAGTFPAYKISQDFEVKSIIKIKGKSASWFSAEAGIVKTESYKENGKYMGKSELTELKK